MSDLENDPGSRKTDIDFDSLAVGAKIGRYEIQSILGQGGFGITYRARDDELGREVAVKEYLPQALAIRQDGVTVSPRSTKTAEDFAWGRDRFVAEGRTLASLHHAPALVRVHDFLQANGTAYIVMELLRGSTLENRLKGGEVLTAAEIDRILWPLLDGLEQVHDAGFLHRDIKPANIILDSRSNPTLIDFGASRAAMAGRSTAMTAIFTPGYAAAEQMTSAKQGPWTDIYGLSATLYHAIAGHPPPSAFDRMLDDEYVPLSRLAPAGFPPALLAGIDAGLVVRAGDRPQTIATWRTLLGNAAASGSDVTIVLRSPPATSLAAASPSPPAKRGMGLWVGVAVAVLLLAGGGTYVATRPPAVDPVAVAEAQKARAALAAAETAQRKAEDDAAKLRAESEQRQKADAEAAQAKRIEEETRRKAEVDAAAQRKADEEARQKAEADAAAEAAAKRQAEEGDKRTAEAAETALHLTTIDRQHIQVALTSEGFNTGGSDGVLGPHTRDMVSAWQKARNYPVTGYLNGLANQALLKEAAPAISKFDDEQKKLEEDKKATAAAASAAPVPPPAAAQPSAEPAVPAPAADSSPDGIWSGTYDCQASRRPAFTFQIRTVLKNGAASWVPPEMIGTISIAIQVTGANVLFTRTVLGDDDQTTRGDTHLSGKFSGQSITASGKESPFGRNCTVVLSRFDRPSPSRPSGSGGGGGNGHGSNSSKGQR